MNLYIRYFENEVVVPGVQEAVDFLSSLDIEGFPVDDEFRSDLEGFVNSDANYPKRYKVKSNCYFIIIKTNVASLEEFKRNNMKNLMNTENVPSLRIPRGSLISEKKEGWYEATLVFKRGMVHPESHRFQYKDTPFRALVKAESAQHCYDRMVDYLKNRSDIDERSQYPSVKGHNFSFTYAGKEKPAIESVMG